MIKSETIYDGLISVGVCTVVRHLSQTFLKPFTEAVIRGGIRHIEVTLNTDGAYEMLEQLTQYSELIIGAGTVMNEQSARLAISSGAKFLVSPHTSQQILRYGNENGILVIPGALTPTEIVNAVEMGAKLVKVFPASTMGSRYFKELRGPLNKIKLMATGGINIDNVEEFISAGIDVVGVGSALASQAELKEGKWVDIEKRSKLLVSRIAKRRSQSYGAVY